MNIQHKNSQSSAEQSMLLYLTVSYSSRVLNAAEQCWDDRIHSNL